jgi:hypothetical protein
VTVSFAPAFNGDVNGLRLTSKSPVAVKTISERGVFPSFFTVIVVEFCPGNIGDEVSEREGGGGVYWD